MLPLLLYKEMVILSQPSQNILRNRRKSKKPMIIMLSIMFVIFFLLVSLGIYSVLNYSYVNNITIQVMKNFQLLTAISNMFSFDSLCHLELRELSKF